MSNTIPESVLEKIEKQYPLLDGLQGVQYIKREAAIWGAFELDKWISVKDGLPDYHVPVLWLDEEGNMDVIELIKGNKNEWVDKRERHGGTFPIMTHWMLIPKPPKDI
jgi:hypothetical protein